MLQHIEKRHDHIWPAVLRALLSLRRDVGLVQPCDQDAITFLGHRADADLNPGECLRHIDALVTHAPTDVIGTSLIGYLNLSRMGGLVVAMLSSATIDDAIALLQEHADYFFDYQCNIITEEQNGELNLSWQSHLPALAASLYVYVLLAIFRHLAGRQFDYIRVTLPSPGYTILAPISNAQIIPGTQPSLTFLSKWNHARSFQHNPTLLAAVRQTLMPTGKQPLLRRMMTLFESTRHPARLRIQHVAEALGLTESALRKQLKQDGLSFSLSLKRYVHELASQQLLAQMKTDDIAEQLGFADRRSFDRSFKEFTGVSPGQFRQMGNRMRFQRANTSLDNIVSSLPPLPETVRAILALDDKQMQVPGVVALVQKDPIFYAHLMGKASRATFGKKPASLSEAISRNIGLANIKHLAVMYTAQQQLSRQSRFGDVSELTDAMLLSEKVYQLLVKEVPADTRPECEQQLVLFGLLSLLLIFHTDSVYADSALYHWQTEHDFAGFQRRLHAETGICLYGATSLMLLKWGFAGDVNKQLWQLCEHDDQQTQHALYQIKLSHDIAMTLLFPKADEPGRQQWCQHVENDALSQQIMALLAKWQSQ
ncbi:helix-turn-helix domain-containing protein [Alteromonas sp. CYL-A6]|uniref:helix-turn-helix domain-containing protein n=1 Tax=Alteromonas nitratireducens TaxID=3390813 RepID=UPI0034AF3520